MMEMDGARCVGGREGGREGEGGSHVSSHTHDFLGTQQFWSRRVFPSELRATHQ